MTIKERLEKVETFPMPVIIGNRLVHGLGETVSKHDYDALKRAFDKVVEQRDERTDSLYRAWESSKDDRTIEALVESHLEDDDAFVLKAYDNGGEG